jgi:hypothetical protein
VPRGIKVKPSLDGETVVLNLHGISDFDALHSGKYNDEMQFYAFDMLADDGDDIRRLRLIRRQLCCYSHEAALFCLSASDARRQTISHQQKCHRQPIRLWVQWRGFGQTRGCQRPFLWPPIRNS